MKRRFLTLLMTGAMLLSLVVPAMATEEGGVSSGGGYASTAVIATCEGQEYSSLQEALTAAVSSEKDCLEIEIHGDVVLTEPLTVEIPENKELRIIGNENTISPSADNWNAGDALLIVSGGGILCIDQLSFDCCCCADGIHATNVDLDYDGGEIRNCAAASEEAGANFAIQFVSTENRTDSSGPYVFRVRNISVFDGNGISFNAGEDTAIIVKVKSDGDENGWYTKINQITTKGEGICDVRLLAGCFGFKNESWLLDLNLYTFNIIKSWEGWYSVDDTDAAVAVCFGKYYASLEAAVAALENDEDEDEGSIYLLRDAVVSQTIIITENISINGNEKHIGASADLNGAIFSVRGGDGFFRLENATLNIPDGQTGILTDGTSIDVFCCSFAVSENGKAVEISNTERNNFHCNIHDNAINGTVLVNPQTIGKLSLDIDYCDGVALTCSGNLPDGSYIFLGEGTYRTDPTPYYDEDRYTCTEDSGTWEISLTPDKAPVVRIENEKEFYYNDLNRAINSIKQDGAVIQICGQLEVYNKIYIDNGKDFTIQGCEEHNYNALREKACIYTAENFDGDAIMEINSGSRVRLKNVLFSIEPVNQCENCIQIKDDGSALEIEFAILFGGNGPAVQHSGGNPDIALLGGVYENIEGMEDFIPSEENLIFYEQYEEDEYGEYGYNENDGNYFLIPENELEQYDGTRYFSYNYIDYDNEKPYIALEADSMNVNIGDSFTLNVVVHNSDGLAGLGLQVSYDKNVVTPKTVTTCLESVQNAPTYRIDDNNSVINLLWIQDENKTDGDFTFATITFDVKDGIEDGADLYFDLSLIPYASNSEKNLCMVGENGELQFPHYNLAGCGAVIRYMPGDVNGDCNVTIADVQLLLRYIVGYPFRNDDTDESWISGRSSFDENCFRYAGDVDSDDSITVADAVKLLRFVTMDNGEHKYKVTLD